MQAEMKMLLDAVLLSFFFISGVSTCYQAESLKTNLKRSLVALTGSCLLIPCEFQVKDLKLSGLTGSLTGSWLKGSPNFDDTRQNVVYNSTQQSNLYSMQFIGNLTEGNCTTLLSDIVTSYTGNYYFRIESMEYKATASCDALNITVLDSPPSPKLDVSGELKENSSVTLSCSAVTPCPHAPPKLSWNYTEEPVSTNNKNTDPTPVTKIQKTITLSDKHDGLC
ncbi:myelin-associated glycoprotein-like [Synchiropus picturatus]